MLNLIFILLTLFITLFIVTKLAERYAQPMPAQKQAKLARIAMILIMVMLVGKLLQHFFVQ